jgi:hypothetical protein
MKKIPKATYRSVEDLDRYIAEREAEAAKLPPGGPRQSVLMEVSKLRIYADVKRLLKPETRREVS